MSWKKVNLIAVVLFILLAFGKLGASTLQDNSLQGEGALQSAGGYEAKVAAVRAQFAEARSSSSLSNSSGQSSTPESDLGCQDTPEGSAEREYQRLVSIAKAPIPTGEDTSPDYKFTLWLGGTWYKITELMNGGMSKKCQEEENKVRDCKENITKDVCTEDSISNADAATENCDDAYRSQECKDYQDSVNPPRPRAVDGNRGAPKWTVNPVNLNLYLADIPVWYRGPIGLPVDVKLSYNLQTAINGGSPFGNKWQLNYGSYLYTMSNNSGHPAATAVIMPDGKWDLYGLPDETGECNPPYHVFNTLIKVADNRFELRFPDGRVYVYDLPAGTTSSVSLLVERRDAYGQKLSLGYDSKARLTTITDALGKVTTFTYNASGLVVQVTDPFGRFASFEYDADRNLTRITDMGGYWTSFTYDGNAYLTGLANAGGSWGFYFEPEDGIDNDDSPYPPPGSAMGSSSRLTITDPAGGKEEYYRSGASAWHITPKNYVPYVDATNNNYASDPPRTTYGFVMTTNKRGEVGEVISPEGVETNYSYSEIDDSDNNTGNLTAISVPGTMDGKVLTYNAMGRLLSRTDLSAFFSNPVTNMTYASNGVDPIRITDGLGDIVLDYNDAHDITSVTDRLGNTKTFTYNEYGQITSSTDQLGITTNYGYDANHFLSQVTRSGQTLESFTRDAIGRVISHTDASGMTRTYAYNDLDDLIKTSYPNGKDITLTYSSSIPHLVTGITDRAGLATHYTYNASRQLTQIANPEGGITTFTRDANGNITQLTDPLDNAIGFDYDDDDRPIEMTLADGTAASFTYDTGGRLASRTNARDAVTSYSYDGPDTLGMILYSDLTDSVMNRHDQYHRLTSTTDLSGSYDYDHDANSRLTSIDGALDGDTLTFQYDAKDRKVGYTLEGGQSVTYTYDAFDRLTSLQNRAGTFSYSYSGASPHVERLTRPNGSYTEYQYDTLKRLSGVTNRTLAGTIINQYLYSYNDQDLPSSETITNGTPITTFQNGTVTYSYNSVNQLLSSTNPAREYTYDADGNMTQGYVPEGFPFTAVYDAENRLTSIEYTGTDQCAFSYGGNNYSVPCPHTREFRFRSDGVLTRMERTDTVGGDVQTDYVSYGSMPLQERDENNAAIREYTWGLDRDGATGGLLSLRQDDQEYYYLYDGKGNVTAVIDSSQAVVATYAYDPFGKRMTSTGTLDQPYQFSTKLYDEKTGLSSDGYRFYSPEIGRWLTRDQAGASVELNHYGFGPR